MIETRDPLRTRGRCALAWAALLVCTFTSAVSGFSAESPAVLNSITVVPEGKLVRVTLAADAPLESFALSRQGPPDRRDLVVRLRGVVSGVSVPPTDVSGHDPGVTYAISAEEEDGSRVVRIVFEREGDALVRLEHDRGTIALILIPPDSRRTQTADAYRIGADDVLAIAVFGHEDLTKTTKVSPDGLVNFPLIGNVRASGRTVDEVSGEIQERLANDFLVEPHVTVSVWEYLSQWVNVIGEVAKPGRYYMTGPTTLIDAVSQAGGLRPTSGETILVTRRAMESNPSEAGEMMRFSSASLFGDEKTSANIRLRPGDVVNVLAREVIYVSGEVRNPGAYPLDRTTTLLKAITLAGGFTASANTSVLDLIREEGGAQQRMSVNVKEIETRKVPDPILRPGDVVIVRRRS